MSDETRPDESPATPDDEPIVVSLVRKVKKFKITREDGTETEYKLVELDGNDRDKWMDEQNKKLRFDEKGKPTGMSSIVGIQANLLALAVRDHTDARLSVTAIQKWPASALNTLFEVAQRMNGLHKEGMEEAKKA